MFRVLLIVVIVLAVALAAVVLALVASLLWRLATGSRSSPGPGAPAPETPGSVGSTRAGPMRRSIDRKAEQAERGKRAERRAAAILDRLPPHEYRVYHRLFPDRDSSGAVTEADHVVVSRYGIFVVETKGYYGDIYVDRDAKEWLVDRRPGEDRMDNPLVQNESHVRAIAYTLELRGRSWIRSVVCFPDDDSRLRGTAVSNVVTADRLVDHIVGFRSVVLNAEGVDRVLTILDQVAEETPERSARHQRQFGYGLDEFDDL